jgi:hypothetical protein
MNRSLNNLVIQVTENVLVIVGMYVKTVDGNPQVDIVQMIVVRMVIVNNMAPIGIFFVGDVLRKV